MAPEPIGVTHPPTWLYYALQALGAMAVGAIIALVMVFLILNFPLPQQTQASSISITREEYCRQNPTKCPMSSNR